MLITGKQWILLINQQIVSLQHQISQDSVSMSEVSTCSSKVFLFYTWSHSDLGQHSDLIYCFSSVYCKQLCRLYRDLASRAAVSLVEHLDLWQVSDFQQHIKSLNPVLSPPSLASLSLFLPPFFPLPWHGNKLAVIYFSCVALLAAAIFFSLSPASKLLCQWLTWCPGPEGEEGKPSQSSCTSTPTQAKSSSREARATLISTSVIYWPAWMSCTSSPVV